MHIRMLDASGLWKTGVGVCDLGCRAGANGLRSAHKANFGATSGLFAMKNLMQKQKIPSATIHVIV